MDNFKRVRLDDVPGTLVIKSTCLLCGLEIVGDVTQGLREKEQQHIDSDCSKDKKKQAKSV